MKIPNSTFPVYLLNKPNWVRWDGSVKEGTCCQCCQPKLNPWDTHGGRKVYTTPCLSYGMALAHIDTGRHTNTHIQCKKKKNPRLLKTIYTIVLSWILEMYLNDYRDGSQFVICTQNPVSVTWFEQFLRTLRLCSANALIHPLPVLWLNYAKIMIYGP